MFKVQQNGGKRNPCKKETSIQQFFVAFRQISREENVSGIKSLKTILFKFLNLIIITHALRYMYKTL